MTTPKRYAAWSAFYASRVKQWMTADELRAEVGRLSEVGAPSPELLLVHAMRLLDARPVPDALVLDFVKSETRGTTVRTTYRCFSEKAGPMPLRLFAAAHPQQPAPLTEDQVFADDRIMEVNAHAGLPMSRLMVLVRAIEAAILRGIVPAPTTDTTQSHPQRRHTDD